MAVVVLLPAATVLWLTGVAVRNERSAMREQLRETYVIQLQRAAATVDGHWGRIRNRVVELVSHHESGELFRECVRAEIADSVLVIGAGGEPVYPAFNPILLPWSMNQAAWQAAEELEFVDGDNQTAFEAYSVIAGVEPDSNAGWLARLACARCLCRLGKIDEAITVLQTEAEVPGASSPGTPPENPPSKASPADTRVRDTWLDAQLRLVELMKGRQRYVDQMLDVQERLQSALMDYSQPIESGQRLFAMDRYRTLFPEAPVFPTHEALRTVDQFWSDTQHRWQKTGPLMSLSSDSHCVVFESVGLVLVYRDTLQSQSEDLLQPWNTKGSTIRMVSSSDHDSLASASASLPLRTITGRRLVLDPAISISPSGTSGLSSTLYVTAGLVTIVCATLIAMAIVFFVRQRLASAQLKSDLASVVSHELRTPLASVRVLVDTLQEDTHLPVSKQKEYLGLIGKENERLCRMVDSFLSYSRLQREKRPFEMKEQSVSEIIDQAVATMGDRLQLPNCAFSCEIKDEACAVFGEKDALTTVLVNLMDNAVKFGGENPEVAVRVENAGDFVRFEVTDRGIGMSSSEQRRVFDHHFQADTSLSRKHGGFGIGLSLVDKIVKAHKGDLGVESVSGRGSRFWFRIPNADH